MATETRLSDFQKLFSTFFKSHYSRLKQKSCITEITKTLRILSF